MYRLEPLRAVARRLRRQLTRPGIILLYHRVADLASDPWSLAVTPEHFTQHLSVMRRYGSPLRLDQYISTRKARRFPRRPIVLTFDDGYADNLHQAKPLLQDADVPATVFVSTGLLSQHDEFWSDELDRILLQPGTLRPKLELTLEGKVHTWDLGSDVEYSETRQSQYKAWRFWHEPAPTARHQLYRDLWQLLRPLPDLNRQKTLSELCQWAGMTPHGRPSHRVMDAEEVRRLGVDGLVEIASHTVTHPQLSAMPPRLQQQEIEQSKRDLEDILGRSITSFAYPFGGRDMYTAETVSLVKAAGYACACSNFPGLVEPAQSVFELPRIRVHDWNGEEFERKLGQAFKEGWA
jgi:peptidoglycan/xylan/chitin deacetylase (PgdA/CDA1 family)